jgi:hypothetical protein
MQLVNRENRAIDAPLLDINYGWGNRIQLKYQVPYFFDSDGGGPYRGALGNSLLGVKWRFYQQAGEGGWNISTYPQLELNNPDHAYSRGLVERGPRFLLPMEVSKVFGPLETNLEAGYWFTNNTPHERILGFAIGHQFTKRFEGLAEVYDDVLLGGSERSTTVDIGGRYRFCRHIYLLYMLGRSLGALRNQGTGQPAFVGYLGLQLQLEGSSHRKAPNRNHGQRIPYP